MNVQLFGWGKKNRREKKKLRKAKRKVISGGKGREIYIGEKQQKRIHCKGEMDMRARDVHARKGEKDKERNRREGNVCEGGIPEQKRRGRNRGEGNPRRGRDFRDGIINGEGGE